jgi:O-antigen/teichoic acid export membrane protein
MTGALALIIIGAVFLLKNFSLVTGGTWDILWPSLLIALGLGALLRRRGRWRGFWSRRVPDDEEET